VCLQAPLIALYNKYKDSKGKQAKLKSPGQLQELLDVVRALLAEMEAKISSQRYIHCCSCGCGLVVQCYNKLTELVAGSNPPGARGPQNSQASIGRSSVLADWWLIGHSAI
jgi:hypothetical protein